MRHPAVVGRFSFGRTTTNTIRRTRTPPSPRHSICGRCQQQQQHQQHWFTSQGRQQPPYNRGTRPPPYQPNLRYGTTTAPTTAPTAPTTTPTTIFATIETAQDAMDDLLADQRTHSIQPVTPLTVAAFASSSTDAATTPPPHQDQAAGAKLYTATLDYLACLERSVQHGTLTPSRKHGAAVSALIEEVVYLVGQTHQQYYSFHSSASSEAVEVIPVTTVIHQVFDLLEHDWNLDVQHVHCEYAIAALCADQRWDAAAALFQRQLDPHQAGFAPVPTTDMVTNPLGLYALTQQQSLPSLHDDEEEDADDDDVEEASSSRARRRVEQVMDAVQQLVMVSPSDHDRYLWAAGTALGYAGYGDAFDKYRRDPTRTTTFSSNSSHRRKTVGVAAVLHACCLCQHYATAVQILVDEQLLLPGTTSTMSLEAEWQWGGQRDRIDPLVRDLAMQVLGGYASTAAARPSPTGAETMPEPTRGVLPVPLETAVADTLSYANVAVGFFRQGREENVTLSWEALLGVMEACEQERDWHSAVAVWTTVIHEEAHHQQQQQEQQYPYDNAALERRRRRHTSSTTTTMTNARRSTTTGCAVSSFLVPGSQLSITEREDEDAGFTRSSSAPTIDGVDDLGQHREEDPRTTTSRSRLSALGPILAAVMRTCNRASNFGLALWSLQLFEGPLGIAASTQHPPTRSTGTTHPHHSIEVDPLSTRRIETSIHEAITGMNNSRAVLTASMIALCGLRCYDTAIRLYEVQQNTPSRRRQNIQSNPGMIHEDAVNSNSINNNNATSAALVYQYALSNNKRTKTVALENPWVSAFHHIDMLMRANTLIRQKSLRRCYDGTMSTSTKKQDLMRLTETQRGMIEDGLARAMQSCTNAHQPELSLFLLAWIEESSIGVCSEQQHGEYHYNDSVTAETILARRWTKDWIGATELFESILSQHTDEDLNHWKQTIAAGLKVLVANGRGGDAVQVFDVLDEDVCSADCYTTIGRYLARAKNWNELLALYRKGVIAERSSSDELGILAMTAVVSSRVENRYRVLRTIIDECATAADIDPKRWTMNNYWHLKRRLGFYHARLLMWWKDEQRAPLDEVNLAIKDFYATKSSHSGPKIDVVRAIVSGAIRIDTLGLEYTKGYERVPRSVEDWANLLQEVLHATEGSSARYDPNFVDSIVHAYISLGRSRECLEYISNVLVIDRTRIRKGTLVEVMSVAKYEHAQELYHDLQMMISIESSK